MAKTAELDGQATTKTAGQHGDIIQSRYGWFFRILDDGTVQSLSDPISSTPFAYRVIPLAEVGPYLILVRDDQPTTEGDPTARKVAQVLARRFVTTEA